MCLFNSSCSPQQVFSPIVMCVGVNGCNVRPDYTYTSCQSKGKRNWKDIKFLVNVPPQKNSLIVWFLVLYMRVKLLGKKGSSELKFKCRQKRKIWNDNTFGDVQRWHFHLHICSTDALTFFSVFLIIRLELKRSNTTFWEIGAKNVGLKSCQLTLLQYRFSWCWTLTS